MNKIRKYTNKEGTEISAVRFDGSNQSECVKLCPFMYTTGDGLVLNIGGGMPTFCTKGEWVVRFEHPEREHGTSKFPPYYEFGIVSNDTISKYWTLSEDGKDEGPRADPAIGDWGWFFNNKEDEAVFSKLSMIISEEITNSPYTDGSGRNWLHFSKKHPNGRFVVTECAEKEIPKPTIENLANGIVGIRYGGDLEVLNAVLKNAFPNHEARVLGISRLYGQALFDKDYWDSSDSTKDFQATHFYPESAFELPKPECIPFTFDDRELFRGKWIRRKGGNAEFLIVCVNNSLVFYGKDSFDSFDTLFETHEFLDGTPFGKLKEKPEGKD